MFKMLVGEFQRAPDVKISYLLGDIVISVPSNLNIGGTRLVRPIGINAPGFKTM
jgi:hypothetical protein